MCTASKSSVYGALDDPLPVELTRRTRRITGRGRYGNKNYEKNYTMTSDKKAESNRRNALKSTGPRTPEGKRAVRLNAVRHGLRAEEILLAGEDEEDALEELGERLRAELQPFGELKNLLVDRIVAAYWRLRRVGRVESGIFA